MTRRGYELTNWEWSVIPNKPLGVPRVDDWRMLNSTLWCY